MLSSTNGKNKKSYDIRQAIETLYVDTAKIEIEDEEVNTDINANTQKIEDMSLFSDFGGIDLDGSYSPAQDVAPVFGDEMNASSSSSANSTCEKRHGEDSSDASSASSAVAHDKDLLSRQDSYDTGDSIFVECTTDDTMVEDNVSRKSFDGGRKKRPSLSQLFRRLSTSERQATRVDAKRTAAALADVQVESLPQQCSARYLGSRPCSGLAGPCHVRGAVEELVEAADKRANNAGSIPQVYLVVSKRGVHVATKEKPSPSGKTSPKISDCNLIPVENISYGTQDAKYTAVFCFIRVRELSACDRTLECHAYVCESPVAARKMAQALKLAFRRCAEKSVKHPFEENGHKINGNRNSPAECEN